jgi:hypothetical protein
MDGELVSVMYFAISNTQLHQAAIVRAQNGGKDAEKQKPRPIYSCSTENSINKVCFNVRAPSHGKINTR